MQPAPGTRPPAAAPGRPPGAADGGAPRVRVSAADWARTARRGSSLGLLAVLLALAAVFSLLGHWQLDRSRERARTSPTEVVVALDAVLAPARPFTGHADHQRVSTTGTWADPASAPPQLVGGRAQDGRDGSWQVAALRVASTGALLPVVTGWLPDGAAAPAAPTGAASLTGRLQLSEDPQGPGPDGRLRAVSSADLVNAWPGPLYTGYLVADAGAAAGADPALAAVPSPPVRPVLDLQNVSYALQWWLFALAALLLWVKVVHDRRRGELEDALWEDGRVPEQTPAAAPAP